MSEPVGENKVPEALAAAAVCDQTSVDMIVATLRVRPETLDGLCYSLRMRRVEIVKCVDTLISEHIVQEIEYEGQSYYTLGW